MATTYWWQHSVTGPFNPPTENGVDIGLPVGTPIYAAYSGTVLAPGSYNPTTGTPESNTGYNPWGGEVDILTNIPGLGQVVNYVFHLDQLVVQAGQHVQAGQLIGYSGGENSLSDPNVVPGYTPTHIVPPNFSSGPHIEWGLYQHTGQSPIDPTPYLQALREKGLNVLSSTSSSGGGPLGIPSIGDIKSGFSDVFQRSGLVFTGVLLALIGVLILFFASPSAHALEQGAAQGAVMAA